MGVASHDSETPAHGQQVITVCAFIHHDFNGLQKVFLPRRATTKRFMPDIYELPGGHVDFGENIVDGLKREVKEELNMTISVGDPFYVFTYHNEIKGSHSIEVIYFAEFIEAIEQITIQPEDHSEYIWLSEDELSKIYGVGGKQSNDPENLALVKGFYLLKGDTLKFR